MNGSRFMMTAVAVLFVLLAPGCGGGGDGAEKADSSDASGEALHAGGIPAVTLRGVDGPDRTIADYRGYILVVNFVASWHGESKAIVECMNGIQNKFRRNVKVVAVTVDDAGPDGARSFARETGARFELFLGSESAIREFGRPSRFPTTFILTRDARIFTKIEGLQRCGNYQDTIISMFTQRM